MKKLTLLLLFLLTLSTFSLAQAPKWAIAMGGAGTDAGVATAIDGSGNVYTTGYFRETVDFDPGTGTLNLTAAGTLADMFIQKLDASGNLIWAKSIGGSTGSEVGEAIALDASGNIYITGYFYGTVDFDPGPGALNMTSAGSGDIYILKLDSGGNVVWSKRMGSTGFDKGLDLAIDALGNVYTTGYFKGTADFDPGSGTRNLSSAGSDDIFVQKLDAAGDYKWAKKMGSTNNDIGDGVAIDALGNIHITGYFTGTVDFDPNTGTTNLASKGGRDIFVQKLNPGGNLLWAKSMGGPSDDWAYDIAIDASNNVYTTGYFSETVDFDPNTGSMNITSAGGIDIFVQKLDASGNFLWTSNMGGVENDYGSSIVVDASDDIYITGYFNGTADFDPGTGIHNLVSAGKHDIYIEKLSSGGDMLWVTRMGGDDTDVGLSVAVDGPDVYTTGYFQNTVDFDFNAGVNELTSAGSSDIFIHKLDFTATGIADQLQSRIKLYPNPSDGLVSIELPEGVRDAQLRVVDGLGRLVHQSRLRQAQNKIDLAHLPAGIYHIEMVLRNEDHFYGQVILR